MDILAFLYLGRSLKLYCKTVKLFDEDVTEVLLCRLKGKKNSEIEKELDKSKSYVCAKITTSYELLDEKIKETLDLVNLGQTIKIE